MRAKPFKYAVIVQAAIEAAETVEAVKSSRW